MSLGPPFLMVIIVFSFPGYCWALRPHRPPRPSWLAGVYVGRGVDAPGYSWESREVGELGQGPQWQQESHGSGNIKRPPGLGPTAE